MPDLRTGSIGVSESLRKFVAEFPYEREPILEFVMQAAKAIPAGAWVADVGAGDAPFRELFSHTRYATLDWAESVHEGAPSSDIVASADAIPVRDGAFDAVLLTQVLEHVPEPASVLSELHRILAKGGALYLTVPLIWERGATLRLERLRGPQPLPGGQRPGRRVAGHHPFHSDGYCSIAGGYVIRDRSMGRGLYGKYVYGDYCKPNLRLASLRTPNAPSRALSAQVPNLVSFGEDGRGRVYAISLDGPVYRLAPR